MKRTNTKEAQEIVQKRIRFYYDDAFLRRTINHIMKEERMTVYNAAKRLVLTLQFGLNEHEIDILINELTKNGIEIGKDNLKDLESKWIWYSNIIAVNVKKILKENSKTSENKIKNKKEKEDINYNYKLARFVKKLGYKTIANEIAQDKRPIQNIDFLLGELSGKEGNDRKFVENDIGKASAIATLEKYKKILQPNDPKILKYIALERKKQNAHFKVAQLYEKIEGANGKDFDKLERTINEAEAKYDKLETQMFKFIKENIKID